MKQTGLYVTICFISGPSASEGIKVSSSEDCFHSSQQLKGGLAKCHRHCSWFTCALHTLLLQHNFQPLRLNTIHSASQCLEISSLQRVRVSTMV